MKTIKQCSFIDVSEATFDDNAKIIEAMKKLGKSQRIELLLSLGIHIRKVTLQKEPLLPRTTVEIDASGSDRPMRIMK